jgi:hypothetical protein
MRVKVLAAVRIDICKKDKIGRQISLDTSSNFITISWEGIMLSLIEAIHEAGDNAKLGHIYGHVLKGAKTLAPGDVRVV